MHRLILLSGLLRDAEYELYCQCGSEMNDKETMKGRSGSSSRADSACGRAQQVPPRDLYALEICPQGHSANGFMPATPCHG